MTPRALDIANRIKRGQTVTQIARNLGVSRTTVYRQLLRLRAAARLHGDRPDWSHPSPELLQLAHTIRHEILAAWHPDA